MKPISKLLFILYNLILIFIFKSFVNSQTEMSVTLTTIDSHTDDTKPLLTLINTNRKLYYLYFTQKIYTYDYINNLITTTVNLSPNFQANQVSSYGFDKDFSTIFIINKEGSYYCLYVDNSNDLLSPIFYSINKNIRSVFSIGNGENDWRFVAINDDKIEFYNFLNIQQNDFTSYLAIGEMLYPIEDIKCTYYNNQVYCIGYLFTDNYLLHIIPIEQISNSNEITIDNNNDYYLIGEFLKIYNFLYSQPLVVLKEASTIFILDFYNNKITIENSDDIFYEDGFLIGEINKNQYYMCSIKKTNTNMILCNMIPYSQNTIASNSVNLEQDIYRFTTNYKYLLGNENNNGGIIMTLIDNSGTFSFIGILDPSISSTLINVYPQEYSDNSITNTINCYNLDIYNNYHLSMI